MIFFQERILKKLSTLLVDSIWAKPYLEKLNGQVIELRVLDTGLAFKVSLEDEAFSILDQDEPSTLVIKGRIGDLMSLAYYARRGESIPASVSPAENFEKILINFRLDSCSKEYKVKLIDFCIQYKLTSAMMYICLNTYGEQGAL